MDLSLSIALEAPFEAGTSTSPLPLHSKYTTALYIPLLALDFL